MPCHMHSSVTSTRWRLAGSTSPTKNVALVSPCTPSMKVVTSRLTMSPSTQRPVVGDAVADHLVDRRAHALRVPVVVERAGVGAALDVEVVHEHVDLVGRDPRRTGSPARRSTSAATAPARRMRSMTSGDLTRGSSHRTTSPVSAYGGRSMWSGTRASARPHPARRGPRALWQRLYLRPLPHQHRSFACGSVAGGLAGSATVRTIPPFYELSAPDEPSGNLKQTDPGVFRGRGGRSARWSPARW